jgi:uncharacterized protein (DUF1697 family)
MPDRYTAWLRGINVGGKNKLPMKQLVGVFEAAGCTNVRTYIQSGNVVLHASPTVARRLSTVIEAAITDTFGFASPVILRSASALRRAADENPFLARGIPSEQVYLALLRDAPKAERIAALDPARSPGDAFEVVGDHLYLHLPNGVGKSKLTNAYFDRALATVSTIRNWRTILAVLDLAEA